MEGKAIPYLANGPLAHATTDLDGRFLNVDDRFCGLVRRDRADIVGRTILDLTGEEFRPLNADMLDALRATGEPFVIRKTYLCGDGSQQAVENSVSIQDGDDGPRLTASVLAIRDDPASRLKASVEAAASLLAERRGRPVAELTLDDSDWAILFAAFVAEARGEANWAGDLSREAGGDSAFNLLRIWELVKAGVLVTDGSPASLERASVRISDRHGRLVEQHLHGLCEAWPAG